MCLLLITSTVNVNSSLTVLIDPKRRLDQYVDSILFYLTSSIIEKIIICDNSSFDYSNIKVIRELALKNNKQIEFLSFQGSVNKIQECGKGYGEGEIVKYVFLNSELYRGSEKSFLKVTGRLKVLNIDNVLRRTKSNFNYFQSVNLNPFIKFERVDTRLYQLRKDDYNEYFKECYQDVRDDEEVYLEHVFYNVITKNNIPIYSFKLLQNFLGISGSTGMTYKMSKVQYLIRQTVYTLSKIFKK